jgi:DNA-directed RNA polymerase specialized sigma24 family protein
MTLPPEAFVDIAAPEPYEQSDRQDALDRARDRVFEILANDRPDAVGAQVVELVGLHGYTGAQAAERLGISADAAKSALYRARVKLAPHWDEIAAILNGE